jgi:hypothetical protein
LEALAPVKNPDLHSGVGADTLAACMETDAISNSESSALRKKKTLLLHQQQEERKRSSDARTKQDFGDGTFRVPGVFFFVLFRLLFPQATRPLPPGKSLTSARLSIG